MSSPAFTAWSVWSSHNILLDKFPLCIPTSGALLSFFATLHKNAKKRASKEFSDDIAIVELQKKCWRTPKLVKKEIPRGQHKFQQPFFICLFSVWMQALLFFPDIPFIFLRHSTTEARLLKFNVCLQTHTSLMSHMVIFELVAHLVWEFSSLKPSSIYFLGLWVRKLLFLHPAELAVLESQDVPVWPNSTPGQGLRVDSLPACLQCQE